MFDNLVFPSMRQLSLSLVRSFMCFYASALEGTLVLCLIAMSITLALCAETLGREGERRDEIVSLAREHRARERRRPVGMLRTFGAFFLLTFHVLYWLHDVAVH